MISRFKNVSKKMNRCKGGAQTLITYCGTYRKGRTCGGNGRRSSIKADDYRIASIRHTKLCYIEKSLPH